MAVREQVRRLGLVVAILVGVVALMRFVVLPRSVFSTRLHQASTVKREVAKPVHFAGMAACRECHSDVYDTKAAGYHRNLGCEVCHGPAGNPQEAAILPKLQLMMAFPLASGGALIRSDGYIFGMITTGRGVMPPYGHQVSYYDRWNVVNYVRQLQGRIAAPAAAGAPAPAAADSAQGGR